VLVDSRETIVSTGAGEHAAKINNPGSSFLIGVSPPRLKTPRAEETRKKKI
jgi:hypothetical protein